MTADRKHNVALTITARTDTFILGLGADENERVSLTIARGKAYLAAGADLVFVPFVVEPSIVERLADAFDGRLNVMAMPGAPSAGDLFRAGAQRLSIGQAAMLATLGLVSTIATELKSTGTWSSIEKTFFGFIEGDTLFPDGRSHGKYPLCWATTSKPSIALPPIRRPYSFATNCRRQAAGVVP